MTTRELRDRATCTLCLRRRRVLERHGDHWLCRPCSLQRTIGKFLGKRDSIKVPASSADSRPVTADDAPTLPDEE